MKRVRAPSRATLRLLAALLTQPDAARYGYELLETTGIKSGTLYPILMRLSERGFLDAEWRDSPEPGRPARHVYRLTDAGAAYASDALQNAKTRPASQQEKAHA